jgi:glyoxylase-like metal-dependent hydrolase (beta-lactamase superfamily II)
MATSQLHLEKVSSSVWVHTGEITVGNVAAIHLGRSAMVVDSGADPVAGSILRKTVEDTLGVPVKYLALTHHHHDHVWGNQAFSDCIIIATEATKNAMKHAINTEWTPEGIQEKNKFNPNSKDNLKDLHFILPNKTFSNCLVLSDVPLQVQMNEVGGHTTGDCYLYIPDEQVAITGDLVNSTQWPYAGDPKVHPNRWLAAMDALLELNPRILIPGHGHVLTRDHLPEVLNLLNRIMRYLEEKAKQHMLVEDIINQPDLPRLPYPENEWSAHAKPITIRRLYDWVKQNRI